MSVQQLEPEVSAQVAIVPRSARAQPRASGFRRQRQFEVAIDVVRQVIQTLWAHKLRSFLTMFGIAWGVASLLLLVGMGEGFRSRNQREMDELGRDLMFLFPGRAPAVEGSLRSGRYYSLTYQDYLDAARAPFVRVAVPVIVRDDVRAVSEFASANGQVTGVEPQYADIRYLPILQGRWLNGSDEQDARAVIMLGDEVRKNLFPGQPSLDARVILNGVPFTVVGTVKRVGQIGRASCRERV